MQKYSPQAGEGCRVVPVPLLAGILVCDLISDLCAVLLCYACHANLVWAAFHWGEMLGCVHRLIDNHTFLVGQASMTNDDDRELADVLVVTLGLMRQL